MMDFKLAEALRDILNWFEGEGTRNSVEVKLQHAKGVLAEFDAMVAQMGEDLGDLEKQGMGQIL